MERRVRGNVQARCGGGEKTEITSKSYLFLFYYITPSGKRINEKLVIPEEKGKYTVAMAVRDEYDAWSDYTVKSVNVNVIPNNDEPPVAGFTTSHINTYRGVEITINSTAYDKEDGARENLPHMYYVRNVTAGGNESIQSDSRTSWVKKFNTLGTFNIRQVVEDSVGQTATFERQVTIHNRKPVATVTTPAATSASNPTVLDTLKPTLQFSYYDADGDQQAQYQLQVYHVSGNLLYDSKAQESAAKAHTVTKNLQEGITMYTIARVHDGYEWGNWSDPKYFTIVTNRPPTGDFDWSPKPVYEGDTVTFTLSGSDPDNDELTLTFELTSPSGKKTSFEQGRLAPAEGASGTKYTTLKHTLRMLELGNWTAKMTVSDGKAPTVTVQKTVIVNELGILGSVSHTPSWLENLHKFNASLDLALKQGDLSREEYNKKHRDLTDFWAGESFLLAADTTDIKNGSSVIAEAVWSTVSGTAIPSGALTDWRNSYLDRDLTKVTNSKNNWSGRVNDPEKDLKVNGIRLEQLQNGYLDFTFHVRYSNGITKQTTERVNVKNKWNEYYQLHRAK